MRDVTILYQGGSGGFALYYYLILSGKFYVDKNNWREQFGQHLVQQPRVWKDTEFWPNNVELKNSNKSPKLFLICNPCWDHNMIQQNLKISNNTHKILLYTDLKLQLRMAYEKRAYWFTEISKQAFNAPANEQKYIKHIIQTSNQGFDPLVNRVRQIFAPDQEIRLEDFVRNGLDNPNANQIEFLNYWKSIQPAKAVRLLDR